MSKDGKDWDSPVILDDFSKLQEWALDDLNECVNFYFEIRRDSTSCTTCGGNGYHPDAQWVSESFYGHSTPFRHQTRREEEARAIMRAFGGGERTTALGFESFPSETTLAKFAPAFRTFCEEMRAGDYFWCDKITQDEVDALVEAGRLPKWSEGRWEKSARNVAEVNRANQRGASPMGGLGHDAINRSILIRARCKRFGIPVLCPTCEGHGYVYVAPAAHLGLVLWWLHPRKGCSRGIDVKNVSREQFPAALAFLKEAAGRNAVRFARVVAQTST